MPPSQPPLRVTNSAGSFNQIPVHILQFSGATLTSVSPTEVRVEVAGGGTTFSIPLIVDSGGTGATSFQENAILYHSGGVFRADSSVFSLDTANQVGIGTANPPKRLHYVGDDGALSSLPTIFARNQPIFENDQNLLLTILTPDSNIGAIYFGDSSSVEQGIIRYDHGDDSMDIVVNDAQRMTFKSNGDIGIGTDSPTTALHLASNGSPDLRIESLDTTVGAGDAIGSITWESADVASNPPTDDVVAKIEVIAEDTIFASNWRS